MNGIHAGRRQAVGGRRQPDSQLSSPVTACRLPPTAYRRSGFTVIEIVVAIGVAAVLFGICVTVFVKVNAFKRRSEQLLFMHQEANGALTRMARDIEGLYVAGGNLTAYWDLRKSDAGYSGDHLYLLAATENRGKADFCRIEYYVQNGKLYRVLSGGEPPGGGWPSGEACVLAGGKDVQIEDLYVEAYPPAPAAGKVPSWVKVTLKIADPKFLSRTFWVQVRPGSEEN